MPAVDGGTVEVLNDTFYSFNNFTEKTAKNPRRSSVAGYVIKSGALLCSGPPEFSVKNPSVKWKKSCHVFPHGYMIKQTQEQNRSAREVGRKLS